VGRGAVPPTSNEGDGGGATEITSAGQGTEVKTESTGPGQQEGNKDESAGGST